MDADSCACLTTHPVLRLLPPESRQAAKPKTAGVVTLTAYGVQPHPTHTHPSISPYISLFLFSSRACHPSRLLSLSYFLYPVPPRTCRHRPLTTSSNSPFHVKASAAPHLDRARDDSAARRLLPRGDSYSLTLGECPYPWSRSLRPSCAVIGAIIFMQMLTAPLKR